MQLKDANWTVFGWSLAGAFIFGLAYAFFIRWVSKKGLVGQTAWSVVIGVTGVLLTMIPFFSIDIIVLIFPFFGVAGMPMIIEYIARVQADIKRDADNAREVAKGLVNDQQAGNR